MSYLKVNLAEGIDFLLGVVQGSKLSHQVLDKKVGTIDKIG